MNTLYPASPSNFDASLIEPSAAFRKNVINVATSIFLFFIFYLVLLALAVALLAGCIMAGGFIISLKIHWFTLAIGAGLVVLGIMVFVFFFKFIFSVSKDINESRVEIKETDQPDLFAFIRQLSHDVKAPFPKKIFLSPDVNAAVFYNSSFLSLFFPIRKNLEIGLGLVNSLTVSEFKAVLAHEFGHFSQKSMKLGSYVYTVNRVLYNLVYEYDGWDRLLLRWESVGGVFGIFAHITGGIINVLRSLLKEAYKLITLRYMALSREMEYNADIVAASVAGEKHMINALRKLDFTASIFNVTVEKLRSLGQRKLKCDDIFSRHLFLNKYYANKLNWEVQDDMVLIKDDVEHVNVQSRLKITDQWASHPEFEERKQNLEKCKLDVEDASASAWLLFNQPEKVKREMTEHFYKLNLDESASNLMNNEEFEMQVVEDDLESRINPAFNGFYSGRLLPAIDDELLKPGQANSVEVAFENLYSRNNKLRIDRYFQNKADLETLVVIRDEAANIKSFDFDGVKYQRKELASVISSLEKEIAEEEKWFKEINQAAFLYNYNKASKQGSAEVYLNQYQKLQQLQKMFEDSAALHQSLQDLIRRIQSQAQYTGDEVMRFNDEIRSNQIKTRNLINEFPFAIESYAVNDEQLNCINRVKESKVEYEPTVVNFETETFNCTYQAMQVAYTAVYREWRLKLIDLTNYQYSLN